MQFDINKRRVCPSCGEVSRQFGVLRCPKCNVPYEDECILSKPDEFEIKEGVLIHYNGKATHIRVPQGVHTIGENAFVNVTTHTSEESYPPMFWDYYGCDSRGVATVTTTTYDGIQSIRHVTLPEGVVCIKKHAFYRCHHLEEVVLPDTLQTIEYRAFCGCGRLHQINFPKNMVLEWNAFESCSESMRKTAEEFQQASGKPLQIKGYGVNVIKY